MVMMNQETHPGTFTNRFLSSYQSDTRNLMRLGKKSARVNLFNPHLTGTFDSNIFREYTVELGNPARQKL